MREFRGNFAGYMRQVRAGSSFAATVREEVVAIVQPPGPAGRRRPGTLRGQIAMAEDFDVLSSEMLAALEDEEP